jgi:glycine/D-amino acid oxidase-like deaminating enzyme
MKKIAVIGGGVTGLAVAYGLAKQGSEVTVFE